jgi:hypothetical protein
MHRFTDNYALFHTPHSGHNVDLKWKQTLQIGTKTGSWSPENAIYVLLLAPAVRLSQAVAFQHRSPKTLVRNISPRSTAETHRRPPTASRSIPPLTASHR